MLRFPAFLKESLAKNFLGGVIVTVRELLASYGDELNNKEETRRTLRPDGFQFYCKGCSNPFESFRPPFSKGGEVKGE